jgi:hypothetical protein
MYEIELPGLPAFHVAATLATYGLYAMIPDAKIHYKASAGSYHPILTSQFQSINELSEFLVDKNTWKDIPPDKVNMNTIQLNLKEFNKLFAYDESLALAIGTDLYLLEDGTEINVRRSPFYFLARKATFSSEVNKLKKMIGDCQEVKENLEKFQWLFKSGQNFGFFSEDVPCNTFKNKSGNKSGEQVVPIICLLAIAGLKTLPCFVYGNTVVTPGWSKIDNSFYFTYPAWSRPLTKREAVAQLHNADLSSFAKSRVAWNRFGILAVYQAKKVSFPKGGGYVESAHSL